jgi:hypothetical protein
MDRENALPDQEEEVRSMELGTFLLLGAFAYGIGVFWYDLLPAKLAERPWRVAAYPLVGIVLAEAVTPAGWLGPAFGSLHAMPLVVGSLIGVLVDWLVTSYRHPAAIAAPELHAGRA